MAPEKSLVYHILLKRGKTAKFSPADYWKSTLVLQQMENEEDQESAVSSNSPQVTLRDLLANSNPNDESDSDDDEFIPLTERELANADTDLPMDDDSDDDLSTQHASSRSHALTDTERDHLFSHSLESASLEELFRKTVTSEGFLLDALRKQSGIARDQSTNNELLNSRNAHVARLGSIIKNIEMREQSIKTTLVSGSNADPSQPDPTSQNANRHRRSSSYDDDSADDSDADSFIDDTAYNDFVVDSSSTSAHHAPAVAHSPVHTTTTTNTTTSGASTAQTIPARRVTWGVSHDLDIGSTPGGTRAGDTSTSEVHDERSHTQSAESKEKRSSKDVTFAPEVERALQKLHDKFVALKKDKYPGDNEPKIFPYDECKDELTELQALRMKHVTRGIAHFNARIHLMPLMKQFGMNAVKTITKVAQTHNEAKEIHDQVTAFKQELRNLVRGDITSALVKKMGTKEKEKENRAELEKKTYDELLAQCKSQSSLQVRWSQPTNDAFHKLVKLCRQYVNRHNEAEKQIPRGRGPSKTKLELLNEDAEVRKLLKEIEVFWPHDIHKTLITKLKKFDNLDQKTTPSEKKKKDSKKDEDSAKKKESSASKKRKRTSTSASSPTVGEANSSKEPPQKRSKTGADEKKSGKEDTPKQMSGASPKTPSEAQGTASSTSPFLSPTPAALRLSETPQATTATESNSGGVAPVNLQEQLTTSDKTAKFQTATKE